MKILAGKPLPIGTWKNGDILNFSVSVDKGADCRLLLYKQGEATPSKRIEMKNSVGSLWSVALEGVGSEFESYNYEVDGLILLDPRSLGLIGREEWKGQRDPLSGQVRSLLMTPEFDWEGDAPLHLPEDELIAYSLHVRGFTKGAAAGVRHKGTFMGIIEKLNYLMDLGINQLHLMPIYDFEENLRYTNYWGYGEGFFFAPKAAYASNGSGINEFKALVKACHKVGIEVVVEMPFQEKETPWLIVECLRYYAMEYHVDGFILNPALISIDELRADPVLTKTRILYHDLTFQNTMRRFLKGDEGMVGEVARCITRSLRGSGTYNYIANHNGFTLQDLVSYDGKHNEANGENNTDGPDYNYSWNCGAEGPTRKKSVLALRTNQVKNALFLVFLSQGIPCLLAGDEFGNTMKGNNNVYCQDNEISWLDWRLEKKNRELVTFVKSLIAMRKQYKTLHAKEELLGMDVSSRGIPDVSYHGESAWQAPLEIASRILGIYYRGNEEASSECFVAYNMHWISHEFALPSTNQGKKWYRVASTKEGIFDKPELLKEQRKTLLPERTIEVFIRK
ncbi:pullulanase/glycogen debranching enzyme [Lachnospiraceae bacterium PF1-22]|uniref:alpha-amylase family glycosyl hydrolase n=1 Tax=Ohessyouella blattaphilus TaxID=2949333 RepID=UPI003E28FED4